MFRPNNPNFFKLKFKFSKKSVKFISGLAQKWMTIKDICISIIPTDSSSAVLSTPQSQTQQYH